MTPFFEYNKKKERRLFDGKTWDDMPMFAGIEGVRYEYVQMRKT